jgi:hypothetical protein
MALCMGGAQALPRGARANTSDGQVTGVEAPAALQADDVGRSTGEIGVEVEIAPTLRAGFVQHDSHPFTGPRRAEPVSFCVAPLIHLNLLATGLLAIGPPAHSQAGTGIVVTRRRVKRHHPSSRSTLGGERRDAGVKEQQRWDSGAQH